MLNLLRRSFTVSDRSSDRAAARSSACTSSRQDARRPLTATPGSVGLERMKPWLDLQGPQFYNLQKDKPLSRSRRSVFRIVSPISCEKYQTSPTRPPSSRISISSLRSPSRISPAAWASRSGFSRATTLIGAGCKIGRRTPGIPPREFSANPQ